MRVRVWTRWPITVESLWESPIPRYLSEKESKRRKVDEDKNTPTLLLDR